MISRKPLYRNFPFMFSRQHTRATRKLSSSAMSTSQLASASPLMGPNLWQPSLSEKPQKPLISRVSPGANHLSHKGLQVLLLLQGWVIVGCGRRNFLECSLGYQETGACCRHENCDLFYNPLARIGKGLNIMFWSGEVMGKDFSEASKCPLCFELCTAYLCACFCDPLSPAQHFSVQTHKRPKFSPPSRLWAQS